MRLLPAIVVVIALLAGDQSGNPETIIRSTLLAVEEFTDDAAPTDDMTLLVAKVS